jgi:putative endonuclease
MGSGREVCRAVVAQLVERVLGKDEVTSSILVNGSRVLKYFVYVLRSVPSGKHYIGIAADVERRLGEHNTRSGRWTSSFKPWELVVSEEHPDRSSAAQRERFLKSRAGMAARKELYGEGKI